MKITLKNYEEYALDYLEGRLNEETRASFDKFLDQHPEIREELKSVRPLDLPDTQPPEYPGKEALLRDSAFIRAIRRPLYVPVWSVAACLLLLLGFFLWWNVTVPEQSTTNSMAVQPQFESLEKGNPVEKLRENRRQGNFFAEPSQSDGDRKQSNPVSTIKEKQSKTAANKGNHHRTIGEASNAPNWKNAPVKGRPLTGTEKDPLQVASVPEPSVELEQEEISPPQGLTPNQASISSLEDTQPELLAVSPEKLPEIRAIPPETSDEKEGFFLSDNLAGLTPSSWPGKVKTKDLKDAFFPKAFSD